MSALRRRIAAAVLICALWSTAVVAQGQRAFLELVVNGVSSGDTLVVLRGDDALVSIAALETAGFRAVSGRHDTVNGEEFVSLRSLARHLTFSVSEVDLRLSITADPLLLGRTVRDLSSHAPADLVYRNDVSSFVNYSVNVSSHGTVALVAESATSVHGASIYSTWSVDRSAITRGPTSVTIDQRQALRRWTVGDAFAYGGALGGNTWMAGLSVHKEFSIDPYYVRHPTLSMSTPIAVPSVMEVYVNDRIISAQRVAPGRLDLSALPLTMGRNDARVVVRDAFGQTQEVSATYYLTTMALAAGVHDYQYHVGFRRVGLGASNWDYRAPVVLARHRVGVTDVLTAGGRLELQPHRLFNAGPSANLRTPFGEIELDASASRQQQWGTAARASFNFTGRPITAGGTVTFASPGYTTLTADSIGDAVRREISAFAGVAVGGAVSATLQQGHTRLYKGISRQRSALLISVPVSRAIEGIASVAHVHDERGTRREAYAGIAVLFGQSSVSLTHVRDSQGNRSVFEAQRAAPVGPGWGYQFRAGDGRAGAVNGVARYQNAHGRYELRHDTLGSGTTTTLSWMGAVVGVGGRIYATRPVEESFALVRVPGVEGVRGYASHQEIGRTDDRGDLLVPDLQAYYGNILNIADTDIPFQYAVSATQMTLAPSFRSGAIALFDVQRVQRVIGTIAVSGGRPVAAYGELTLTSAGQGGESYESPVGTGGSFYFENLPAGSYTGKAAGRDTSCSLAITVPVAESMVIKLGTVVCTASRTEP